MSKINLILSDRLFSVGIPFWLFVSIMILLVAWMYFLLCRNDRVRGKKICSAQTVSPLCWHLVIYIVYSRTQGGSHVMIIPEENCNYLSDNAFFFVNKNY